MKKEKKYKSSGILLEMAKEQYAAEAARSDGLDGKASFFITLIIAVATIFVPIFPFGKLTMIFAVGTCSQKWISGITTLGVVMAFALLIIAFKHLYEAYKLRDYMRPSLDCIDTESNHTAPMDKLNKGLCDHYKFVVDSNIETNNKKAESINKGVKFSGFGFAILIVSTIGILVTAGGT